MTTLTPQKPATPKPAGGVPAPAAAPRNDGWDRAYKMSFVEGPQACLGQSFRVAGKADAALHGSRGVGRGGSYGSGHCRLDDLIF